MTGAHTEPEYARIGLYGESTRPQPADVRYSGLANGRILRSHARALRGPPMHQ